MFLLASEMPVGPDKLYIFDSGVLGSLLRLGDLCGFP